MVVLLFLAIAATVPLLSGVASAQNATNVSDVAPYYANESKNVSTDSWYAGIENATVDSLGDMAVRLGPFFIGTGDLDRSGTGYEGVLLSAIVMVLMFIGAVAMLPVGSTGGVVLAVVVGYGMTELGLAPSWFRILLLFAVGIIVFVAFLRAQKGR